MAASKKIVLKKQQLRNNEYYNTQEVQDKLYSQSKQNYVFQNLISKIVEKENILVAYRNIKRNAGSKTPGVDGYTIEDRMVQQCIKQILEPIVEAKFYHGSYGFRPDRGTENAIARVYQLVSINKLHYAVDIDIKSFFDNVDHGKLLKQIWTMGIRDKKLLSIISSMMKAEIESIGIPQKGVPQGGILSPLLSNIVLNELDWWISSQWETMKTKNYSDSGSKIRALKRSNLKEMYIVRYADDFKILTKDVKSAQKIYVTVSNWLKERLSLDVNKEKSQIINLRKNYSNFLGIKIKVIKKAKGYVVRSRISDKANKKIKDKIKNQIEEIRKKCTVNNVVRLNSMILGWHNYYSMATLVNIDFSEINFLVRKRLYGKYNFKTTSIYNRGKIFYP